VICLKESGNLVLGAGLDDGSQGSSGRLCNLNQVDQAEELYKKESFPLSQESFL
jgi:hypothetical protein